MVLKRSNTIPAAALRQQRKHWIALLSRWFVLLSALETFVVFFVADTFESLSLLSASSSWMRELTNESIELVLKKPQSTCKVVPNSNSTPSEQESCWTILWLQPEADWERNYIYDMLKGLNICETLHVKRNKMRSHLHLKNRTIVVAKRGRGSQQAAEMLSACGFVFVTFIMAQESHHYSRRCVGDGPSVEPWMREVIDHSSLVLRNYWTEDCAKIDKVVQVPLYVTARAYDSGFAEVCGDHFGKPPLERDTLFYFSSNHKLAPREKFIEMVKEIASKREDGEKFKIYDKHDTPPLETSNLYTVNLSDSRYGFVVPGNVEDTWRFTETMFCGAIPVLEKPVYDYYEKWLPKYLMEVLPYYQGNDPDVIRYQVEELLDYTDDEYMEHYDVVTKKAKVWMDSVRSDVVSRIQSLV